MGRQCFWTAVIVYLLISFVPALAAPNLLGAITGRRRKVAA